MASIPNRIQTAIERTAKRIVQRLKNGQTTQEKVDALNTSLDMDTDEYCKFQELKSAAHASGDLSDDEAMTVYGYLGLIPSTFNSQPVYVKSVLTQLFGELLERRIGKRGVAC